MTWPIHTCDMTHLDMQIVRLPSGCPVASTSTQTATHTATHIATHTATLIATNTGIHQYPKLGAHCSQVPCVAVCVVSYCSVLLQCVVAVCCCSVLRIVVVVCCSVHPKLGAHGSQVPCVAVCAVCCCIVLQYVPQVGRSLTAARSHGLQYLVAVCCCSVLLTVCFGSVLLQCVAAVFCSVQPTLGAHGSQVPCAVLCCSVLLQFTHSCCSVLQYAPQVWRSWQPSPMGCSVLLQWAVAMCYCSVLLQCVVAVCCCSVLLQCVAVYTPI